MRYLLDTNILIAMSKERPGLAARLGSYLSSDILLSTVVLAELEFGIAKSTRQKGNREVFDALTQGFPIVPFDAAAAHQYGLLRASLEKRGQLIGPNDLMIAAQALALGVVLVTDNVDEFSRVQGLVIENWLA